MDGRTLGKEPLGPIPYLGQRVETEGPGFCSSLDCVRSCLDSNQVVK